MKRFFITTILTVTACICFSAKPVKLDTLYYDKDWKPIAIAAFANYYRVYEATNTSQAAKPFRDYYITGEIYADGKYLSLDPDNDDLSVFEDKMLIYYKNGKTAKELFYKNGVLDGDYKEYFENGLVALSTFYKEGKEDGIRTEFGENGERYTKVEMKNGRPQYDYYFASTKDGQLSKLSIENNKPIWDDPDWDDCKSIYRDGTNWLVYTNNGIAVGCTVKKVKEKYGKWWCLDIVIGNNSVVPIELDPERITASVSKSKYFPTGPYGRAFEDVDYELPVLSFEDYMRKVKRQQNWQAFATAVSTGIQLFNAGWSVSSTSTTTSTNAHSRVYGNASVRGAAVGYATDGRSAVVGAGAGYATGSYSGSGYYSGTTTTNSITVSYDAAAAYQAQVLAQHEWRNMENEFNYDRNVREEGYLKRNTINPGEVVKGYVNIKYDDGESLTIVIDIDNVKYIFTHDVRKKKKKKK